MKTKFIINGANISIVRLNDETALDALPPRIYTIQFDDQIGFYLSITKDQLQLPKKIYGDYQARVNQCITTYNDRSSSTGILLTGDKGTGKTLLMSLLANAVITENKIPVILVNSPYSGDKFMSFIEALGECCLVFDEVGKMYSARDRDDSRPSQENLLSLMDGVDKTKRLILMTENEIYNISSFMLNRPSRIYYHFQYKKLNESSINEYCVEHNVDETTTQDVVDLSRRTAIFSFDMLQSIIEEHNRFGESVSIIIENLNIDSRESAGTSLEIFKVVHTADNTECKVVGSNIISKPDRNASRYSYVRIEHKSKKIDPFDEIMSGDTADPSHYNLGFSHDQIVYESPSHLVYETEDYMVYAREIMMSQYNYDAY